VSELFRETITAAEKAVTDGGGPVGDNIYRLLANPSEFESANDGDRAYLALMLDSSGFRDESERILRESSEPGQVSANAALRNVEGMLAAEHGDYNRAKQILKDALQAASDSPVLRVKIQANLAAVNWGAGELNAAEAWADAASAQQEGLTPASEVLIASVRAGIASIRGNLQGLRAASVSLGAASQARIDELGAHHPHALATVANMARIQIWLARAEDSRIRLERAIRVLEVTAFRLAAELGADHPFALEAKACLSAAESGQRDVSAPVGQAGKADVARQQDRAQGEPLPTAFFSWLERDLQQQSASQRTQVEATKLLAMLSLVVAAIFMASALQAGRNRADNITSVWLIGFAFLAMILVIMLDRFTIIDRTAVLNEVALGSIDEEQGLTRIRKDSMINVLNNDAIVRRVRIAAGVTLLLAVASAAFAIGSLTG
jgi:hypothetical protein